MLWLRSTLLCCCAITIKCGLLAPRSSQYRRGPVICIDDDGVLSAIPRNGGGCPLNTTKDWKGAGINIFDSWWDTSPAMGRPTDIYDTILSFETAKNANIRFFRFFASPYGVDKTYWVDHTDEYWDEMDIFFDAIDASGLYAIPSIGYNNWHKVANAITPGLKETMNDFVLNSTSVSQTLCRKYFTDFVIRYHGRKSILLWELGNELNLLVNLPPPYCDKHEQCFNTTAMVKLTRSLAKQIKTIDSSRPISSGFSSPRPSAWHQEYCRFSLLLNDNRKDNFCDLSNLPRSINLDHSPISSWSEEEWEMLADLCPNGVGNVRSVATVNDNNYEGLDCDSGYWGTDTKAQWSEQLKLQNTAVDVWSLHQYENPKTCYFDKNNCTKDATLMATASAVALEEDAMLYVGEYGGQGPNFTGPTETDQQFPSQMLNVQISDANVGGAFAISSIWSWMCPTHRKDMVCIWPNSAIPKERGSNRMIQIIQNANDKLQKINATPTTTKTTTRTIGTNAFNDSFLNS